jgi:hypothetical protein
MRFVPYGAAGGSPNVIVDGAPTERTLLTLSHWPHSGTPEALMADTSTAIVFNYLDSPTLHVRADAASNNHFDEDGLAGLFALIDPAAAERHRALLLDVAQTGDFGVCSTREAARIAFAIAGYADAATSPLPTDLFERPYPELAAGLYGRVLDELPAMLSGIAAYRPLWERQDALLTASERAIESGVVTIDERPGLDLAVVRLPETVGECHPVAVHNRTRCTRLLVVHGRRIELRYRYEGWVQLASRRPAARVDLSALAAELNVLEAGGGRWVFDGVDRITPRLHVEPGIASSIAPETILARVEHHLRTGTPAWNPYD